MYNMPTSGVVILDRDGVINEDSDDYIKSAEEWIPIPGSVEAIATLSKAGYTVAVATNQSGLARGYFDEYELARMHALMYELVENAGGLINALVYCPHAPDAGCRCRKPGPGLLEQLAETLNISLEGAWFVGDTEKDIDTALASQCQPILVLTGKGELTARSLSPDKLALITIAPNLQEAVSYILHESAPRQDQP